MFLIFGMLSALLSARRTGTGQVVDACITDGVASLMSLFYAWQPKGLWHDAPASNLLDGGAPFYRCYACADGKFVAVGCLEPKFFAQMLEGLGLAGRGYDQHERAGWPGMEADFEAVFRTRTRDEWGDIFASTDACVTPVLSMAEAPASPHNNARNTFVTLAGVTQPAPSPVSRGLSRQSPPGLRPPSRTSSGLGRSRVIETRSDQTPRRWRCCASAEPGLPSP